MEKARSDTICEVMSHITIFLTVRDVLRISETARDCHEACNESGFESTLLQFEGIQRNTNCHNRLPIKCLLGLFNDTSITCKVYMGYSDTYTSRCTPCIFSMHWNGCTFTTTPLSPFIYHNMIYESIFFPWTVLLSWTKENYKHSQCLFIKLVPNTYLNTAHKIDFVRIFTSETNVTHFLSERLLNRCCMLELLQNGALRLQITSASHYCNVTPLQY